MLMCSRRSASTRIISYKMASRWRMRKRPRGSDPGRVDRERGSRTFRDLDKEYFAWKESDQEEEKKAGGGKKVFSLRQKIKIEEETHEVI